MAVLDGHLALAQIMSRGQWLAQSAQLSISPFGPDAADGVLPQLHFPEQHQLDIWGPASSSSTQSPVLSAFSDWSGKDLEGTPTSVASSVSGSVTSTPVRMGPLQHAAPLSPCSSPILCWAALTQKPAGGPPPAQQQALPSQMMPCSSTPTARRCLCAALASSPAPAAADAAARPDTAAGCSTPRGSMIPPVLPPPPAPRAPRPTARLLPLDPPPAAAEAASGPGSSGASLCAQHSMGGPSRLQQWLSQMELKLAVPAGNTASILADACPPAPKASLAGMHQEAAPTAARPASSSTGPGSLSKADSNSSASSKKRPLPALWDTLSLLPVSAGGSMDLCMAAGLSDESDECDSSEPGQATAAMGASAFGSPATVRSSKRSRSLDGVASASSSSTGAAAQEGLEFAVDGADGAGGVPAPAFVIMGVLSPRTHLA